MAATQCQPVNPSAGSGGGVAATNSFKESVLHAGGGEVLPSRKAREMMMMSEKAGAKGGMRAVYNNPLDGWRNKAIAFPFLARVARRVVAIPATQAPSERVFFYCKTHCEEKAWFLCPGGGRITGWSPVQLGGCRAVVEEWQQVEPLGLMLGGSSCCELVNRLVSLGVVSKTTDLNGGVFVPVRDGQEKRGQFARDGVQRIVRV